MHSNIAGAIRIPESCYFAGRKSDSVDDSTLNLPTWGLNEGSDPERGRTSEQPSVNGFSPYLASKTPILESEASGRASILLLCRSELRFS